MICRYCGKEIPQGGVVCPFCAQPVAAQQAQRAPQQTQHAAPRGIRYGDGASPAGGARKKGGGGCFLKVLLAVAAVLVLLLALMLLFGEDEESPVSSAGQTSEQGNVSVGTYGEGIYGKDLAGVSFRDNYTKLLGGNEDTVTVMVYMVGSNLESENGCATSDLEEMLAAETGDKLNVVVQTGGASYWQNDRMSSGEVQRWLVQDGSLTELDNLGTESMLQPENVTDFIRFSTEQYPASRYLFLFWDHGGGSLYGYGSDELFPNDVLYLPDIAEALQNSDVQFDIVGFDACLMGSVETAYMLEPYADYLIGSEETEPGYGWDYTGWLTYLGQNTSCDSVDLGVHIVDEFVAENSTSDTLSVISLREIPYVYETLDSYMSTAKSGLVRQEFRQISAARANAKSYADGDYDMVDILDFADAAGLDGAEDLTAAVESAVKYRNNCDLDGSHGLSMYFPYKDLDVYGYAKDYFSTFGFGGACYDFYDTFVNLLAGGQQRSSASSLEENLTGSAAQTDYTGFNWYNADVAESAEASQDELDYTELAIEQSGDNWILPLTDADWEKIDSIQLQVMLDDGAGYLDLGSDQRFDTDENDNLLITFDNTWVAIDGQVVPYYAESVLAHTEDDGYTFTGYVPALLGAEETPIDLILQWDSTDAASGYLAGYRLSEGNNAALGGGTLGKGLQQLKEGDSVTFLCDYFTYDGQYDQSYQLGDVLTVGKTAPTVTYEDVGESPVLVCFQITDLYQSQSWTELVEMS